MAGWSSAAMPPSRPAVLCTKRTSTNFEKVHLPLLFLRLDSGIDLPYHMAQVTGSNPAPCPKLSFLRRLLNMRYALITGGSRGIGAATARAFAQRGWGVAINYHRSQTQAEELAAELSISGVPAIALQGDVSNRAQVNQMVDNLLKKFCQLDILVCNAGVSHTGIISQIDDEQWRRLFGVNVDGVHHCCRAVLPHMLKNQRGAIVTVSSMWGQVGASCEAAYSATKGAVIAYTKALAKELGPSGIRVNCVAPGVIQTQMNAGLSPADLSSLADETPLGRVGTPDEAAQAIAFLASDEASFLTGQVLAPNGGLVI